MNIDGYVKLEKRTFSLYTAENSLKFFP
jgi:hypothetical protein